MKGWFGFVVVAMGLVALLVAPLLRAQNMVEYIHTDAIGTPVVVTDAAGVVIEVSEYEPFGQLVNRPLTDGPGFTGHVQDAVTGLTYMQQRYYDPLLGRFLSVDPVAANSSPGGNFNRFWYAENSPYKFIDPDGRQSTSWVVAHEALYPQNSEQRNQIIDAEIEAGWLGLEIASYSTGGIGIARGLLVRGGASRLMMSWGISLSKSRIALRTAQESYKGSTVAGHSLSKHAGRFPQIWGKMTGSMKTWNEQAMKHLRDIFRSPGKFNEVETKDGIKFMEKRLGDGRGVRLNMDGTFKGFIDQ